MATAKTPRGWTQEEIVTGRTYGLDDRGREVILSEEKGIVYRHQDGTTHAFLPETSTAEINRFLAGHDGKTFRLPPDHPAEEAALTEAQITDSADLASLRTRGLAELPGPAELAVEQEAESG